MRRRWTGTRWAIKCFQNGKFRFWGLRAQADVAAAHAEAERYKADCDRLQRRIDEGHSAVRRVTEVLDWLRAKLAQTGPGAGR